MRQINNIIEDIDISVTNLKYFENSLALRYQEVSKFDKFSFVEEHERIVLFSNPNMIHRAICPYKTYVSKPQIKLGVGYVEDGNPLLHLIANRRTKRLYKDYKISTVELYKILHYSYGITGGAKVRGKNEIWHYRAVPSGGALYPLELYVYINKASIKTGLYHYRPDSDSLEFIDENMKIEQLKPNIACGNINMEECSCIIFITSLFQRSMIKYAERGYRFILQEVGAVCQNISLICESLKLGSCILGGYIDDNINSFLKVISPVETIQGIIVIGKN